MRIVASLIVMAVSLVPAAARASSLAVDAGTSIATPVDVPFLLEARVEDAAGPLTLSWIAPIGCILEDPASAVTAASCSQPGIHPFSVTVNDGTSSASDTVRIVAVLEEIIRQTQTSTIGVAVPDEVTPGSGAIDGATVRLPLDVPSDAASLDATLDWEDPPPADLDIVFEDPEGNRDISRAGETLSRPERVSLWQPIEGRWTAVVQPKASVTTSFTLESTITRRIGDAPMPDVFVRSLHATPGDVVVLDAEISGGTGPYDVVWERDPTSIRFDDGTGGTFSFTFAEPTAVRAKVIDANGFERVATGFVRGHGAEPRAVTVVAVVDNAFTPYHYDFVGSQHPWNVDGDPSNDIDLTADPATYIDGYPGAEPLHVTLPTDPGETVEGRHNGVDADLWRTFASSGDPGPINMYRFPGTKIIGALTFSSTWVGNNSSHGTRSAASAAGNIHGTCPECLVVLIVGGSEDGLRWAAAQEWIDVVTNSYGSNTTPLRDNLYLDAPVSATRAASEAGQTTVFSAGNGLANAFDVPMFTYWSSEKGPDWTITVGAVTPDAKQTYLGHGKPVDISSIGTSYPSSGGGTANGIGTHSGTSNAAPVVAGTFAALIQEAREQLDDTTPTHENSVVASGEPFACGDANPDCVLADGRLTRQELHDVALLATRQSPTALDVQTIPTTEHAYYYQGHGVVLGRIDGDGTYEAERRAYAEILTGARALAARPAIEQRWFAVDSFCRQRLWGSWSGGRYTGALPAVDPANDPIAWPFAQWCSAAPERALARLGDD